MKPLTWFWVFVILTVWLVSLTIARADWCSFVGFALATWTSALAGYVWFDVVAPKVEFTPEEWRWRPAWMIPIQPVHCTRDGSPCGIEDDSETCAYVFICRHSDGGGCGRYCAGCFGGGGSNLCDACWCERESKCQCGDCDIPKPGCLLYEPDCEWPEVSP